jgi:hypothetical protein
MTSLKFKVDVNDTASQKLEAIISNRFQLESPQSIISTSTRIIVNGTTPFTGNLTIRSSTVTTIGTTRIFPLTCMKLKFSYQEYMMLNPSVLKYSSKLQEMIVPPIKNSNKMCSCARKCLNNTSCDYFTVNSKSNCILYKLNGINSNDVMRGINYIQNGQIFSGFKKTWLNQILPS